MGYGRMEQTGEGIHLRQFSRAFVIEDSMTRIAFVSIDSAMMGDHVRTDVSQDHIEQDVPRSCLSSLTIF